MSKIIFSCIAAVFLLTSFTHAEVFNTATVLRTGHFSLNFEAQRDLGPEENMFFFHLGMGLIDAKSDLCFTFGFPADDRETYMGLDLEFVINRSGPAVSFTAGVHKQEDTGVDLRLLISGKFDSFRPYFGLDSDYNFNDVEDYYFVNVLLGFEIRFAENAGFILEYASEIANSHDDIAGTEASYISLGAVIYF